MTTRLAQQLYVILREGGLTAKPWLRKCAICIMTKLQRSAAMNDGLAVLLSNVIEAVIALIEQREGLRTRADVLAFLETVRNEAKSAEDLVKEAQIKPRLWRPN